MLKKIIASIGIVAGLMGLYGYVNLKVTEAFEKLITKFQNYQLLGDMLGLVEPEYEGVKGHHGYTGKITKNEVPYLMFHIKYFGEAFENKYFEEQFALENLEKAQATWSVNGLDVYVFDTNDELKTYYWTIEHEGFEVYYIVKSNEFGIENIHWHLNDYFKENN